MFPFPAPLPGNTPATSSMLRARVVITFEQMQPTAYAVEAKHSNCVDISVQHDDGSLVEQCSQYTHEANTKKRITAIEIASTNSLVKSLSLKQQTINSLRNSECKLAGKVCSFITATD